MKKIIILFLPFQLMAFSQQVVHIVPEATCKLFVFDWTALFSVRLILHINKTYILNWKHIVQSLFQQQQLT